MGNIQDLRTPAFLIDLAVLQRNAQRMSELAQRCDVRLRPHTKTHKTLQIANTQTEGGFRGLTVSTLVEAEYYKQKGFSDITYAFPIHPAKLGEVERISEGIQLHILVDHQEQIQAVQEYASRHRSHFSVMLKIDCGYHRAGVDWSSARAVQMALKLERGRDVHFEGILTHAGHSYDAPNLPKISKIARQERDTMLRFAEKLESEGIYCQTISIGSTPTIMQAESLEGISEIRPGNYIFFDKFQADVGTCQLEDCAATVLAGVVSHYPGRNQMLIDAGAVALSKDPGATHKFPGREVVYGAVLGHPQLKITSLSQEHGLVTADSSIPFQRHPIGSQLRIVPNHSCLTAACFPEYQVVEGDRVKESWRPLRGW